MVGTRRRTSCAQMLDRPNRRHGKSGARRARPSETRICSMTSKIHNSKKWGPATLAIHGQGKHRKAHHAVSTPIVHTSNYSFESTSEVFEFMTGQGPGPRHPRARIRPLRQSDPAGDRAQARRRRGRRTGHPVFHRHERGHPHAHGLHEKGRPHHFHERLLPADARFRDQLSEEIRDSNQPGEPTAAAIEKGWRASRHCLNSLSPPERGAGLG